MKMDLKVMQLRQGGWYEMISTVYEVFYKAYCSYEK
jgi:hypothetical protein